MRALSYGIAVVGFLLATSFLASPIRALAGPIQGDIELDLVDPLLAGNSDLEIRELTVLVLTGSREPLKGEVEHKTADKVHFIVKKNRDDLGFKVVLDLSEVKQEFPANAPEEVYKKLKRKMGFEPQNVQHQRELGVWCVRVALRENARDHLVRALRLDPEQGEIYATTLALFDDKPALQKTPEELDEEIGVFLAGIKSRIRVAELAVRAAESLEALGDAPGAIRMLERFRDPEPDLMDQSADLVKRAQDSLARLLESEGRRDEARTLVEKTLEAREGAEALDLWNLQAMWLLEDVAAGKEEAAANFLATVDSILQADGNNGRAYMLRGSYHMLRENFESAKKDLIKAISRGEVAPGDLLTSALNCARNGEFDQVKEILPTVQAAEGVEVQYRLVKAYDLENQGDTGTAHSVLDEAVAMTPRSWQTWVLKLQATTRLENGALDEREVDRFLEAHGQNLSAFGEAAILRADQALRDGEGDKARRWLDYVREIRGSDTEVLLRTGVAHLYDGGDLALARRVLAAAFEQEPKNTDVQNALGCLEYREGNLETARDHFVSVIDRFPAKARESATPPHDLSYALRGLRQAEDALNEESWVDDFSRVASPQVLNNWVETERDGVNVTLSSNAARFDGDQKFNDQGLTILNREVPSDRLHRFRATIKLERGARATSVALRFEEVGPEPDGLIFFRQPSGVLGFALNRGDEPKVYLPTDKSAEDTGDEDSGTEHHLRKVLWNDDAEHVLEIRFDEEHGTMLYFDGQEVARNINSPVRGKSVLLGVSGQAPKGTSYRFDVSRFEIRRTRPEGAVKRRF